MHVWSRAPAPQTPGHVDQTTPIVPSAACRENSEDGDRIHDVWTRTAAERRLGVVELRRNKGRDRPRRVCTHEAVRDEVRGQEAACERISCYRVELVGGC
jgi:hypothetical protein